MNREQDYRYRREDQWQRRDWDQNREAGQDRSRYEEERYPGPSGRGEERARGERNAQRRYENSGNWDRPERGGEGEPREYQSRGEMEDYGRREYPSERRRPSRDSGFESGYEEDDRGFYADREREEYRGGGGGGRQFGSPHDQGDPGRRGYQHSYEAGYSNEQRGRGERSSWNEPYRSDPREYGGESEYQRRARARGYTPDPRSLQQYNPEDYQYPEARRPRHFDRGESSSDQGRQHYQSGSYGPEPEYGYAERDRGGSEGGRYQGERMQERGGSGERRPWTREDRARYEEWLREHRNSPPETEGERQLEGLQEEERRGSNRGRGGGGYQGQRSPSGSREERGGNRSGRDERSDYEEWLHEHENMPRETEGERQLEGLQPEHRGHHSDHRHEDESVGQPRSQRRFDDPGDEQAVNGQSPRRETRVRAPAKTSGGSRTRQGSGGRSGRRETAGKPG